MIPISIDDINAGWLTTALGARLPAGTTVRSFSVDTIGTGVGLMGLLYRLVLDYDGRPGDAPTTVVVKLPVLIPDTRHVARVYRFYEKEVAFYRDLAPSTPLGTPDVYFADHAPDSDDFVLVMQDLGHLRAADQVAGCERDDALAAVAALAHHHAAFWNDPRFETPDLMWLPLLSDSPTPEGIQQGFDAFWEPFVEFMGDDLHPDVKAAGDWLPGAAYDLLRVPDGHPITLVHGDYRLDNLFFDERRSVSAVDWQIVTRGVGGYDFAYFVTQSLSAADRREHLDRLVETYFATLVSAGVEYPEEQFWLDVRRSVLFCLAYPVQAMALDLTDARAAALVRELAHRSSSAILEMDALQLVPR